MDSLEGFTQVIITDGLSFTRVLLLTTYHVGQRIIQNSHLCLRWLGRKEKIHIFGYHSGYLTCRFGSFGDFAIKLHQAVAARLIPRAHRIVGIDIDSSGSAGDRCPHPVPEIQRHHRKTQLHTEDSVSGLQLTDVESFVLPCHRPSKIMPGCSEKR